MCGQKTTQSPVDTPLRPTTAATSPVTSWSPRPGVFSSSRSCLCLTRRTLLRGNRRRGGREVPDETAVPPVEAEAGQGEVAEREVGQE